MRALTPIMIVAALLMGFFLVFAKTTVVQAQTTIEVEGLGDAPAVQYEEYTLKFTNPVSGAIMSGWFNSWSDGCYREENTPEIICSQGVHTATFNAVYLGNHLDFMDFTLYQPKPANGGYASISSIDVPVVRKDSVTPYGIEVIETTPFTAVLRISVINLKDVDFNGPVGLEVSLPESRDAEAVYEKQVQVPVNGITKFDVVILTANHGRYYFGTYADNGWFLPSQRTLEVSQYYIRLPILLSD